MTAPDPVIDRYLTTVAARLTPVGPAQLRRSILAELRDGLLEACAAHQAHSLTPPQAAAAATAEFGDPHALAAAFTPELAAAQARRTALALIRSGPLVGVL
jgi:hypothetical protein